MAKGRQPRRTDAARQPNSRTEKARSSMQAPVSRSSCSYYHPSRPAPCQLPEEEPDEIARRGLGIWGYKGRQAPTRPRPLPVITLTTDTLALPKYPVPQLPTLHHAYLHCTITIPTPVSSLDGRQDADLRPRRSHARRTPRRTRSSSTPAPAAARTPDANHRLHRAKDAATSQGGKIGHDYNLIKGFS